MIGAAAGLLAAVVGTAASWGVTRFVMRADWVFLPGVLAATIGGCVVLMLVFGYAGTATALRARPAGYSAQRVGLPISLDPEKVLTNIGGTGIPPA